MKKVKVSDKFVYPFSGKDELLDFIKNKKTILIAINAEKIMNRHPELRGIINENTGYPDGIGAIKVLHKKGYKNVRKIPGVELWLDIINRYAGSKAFYFIGGLPNIISCTVQKIKTRYPAINILGFRDGYFDKEEFASIKQEIGALKPDIVFVAMGSPKQELIMRELYQLHPAIYMGLGGSFDVFCNHVKRAPVVFQKLGLEWFYRLLKQPTRIKRQLVLAKFTVYYWLGKL